MNDGVEERDDGGAATLSSIVELWKLIKDRGRRKQWPEQEIVSTHFWSTWSDLIQWDGLGWEALRFLPLFLDPLSHTHTDTPTFLAVDLV